MKEQPEALWLAVRGAFRGGLTLGEVQEAEDELNRLTRERDALLEALKEAVEICIWPSTAFSNAFDKARAAIKAVEEGK